MSVFFHSPLFTILFILFIPVLMLLLPTETLLARGDRTRELSFAWQISLFCSLAALFVGLVSCLAFDKSTLGFQFTSQLLLLGSYNIALSLGVDGLSMVFLLLTLFIFPILILTSWKMSDRPARFVLFLFLLEILLVLTFTTTDLFYFYLFFEGLLIPMFLMIGFWGARERKIKAAYYFFLYTLFGSLFMLFGVLYLYFLTGSTNYGVLFTTVLDLEQQRLIWICFFLAFAVKMPLFPFHIWLPEAHVEAPTVGSMLLASLLLKLGGYGFLRFSLTLLSAGSAYYNSIITVCALLGVIYGSLSTLRQIDLKRIVAYSSVAHMNLVMLAIFSNSQQGLEGAVYLMVGHGVVSTALFFAVGVLYDRHHSRLLRYYGGLATTMPLFATFFLLFTLANMSFPATSNFLGELLIFVGIFENNSTILLFSSVGIVLSAAYSIWLYNRVSFGTLKTQYIQEFKDLTRKERFIFGILLLPMLVLGVTSSFVIDFLHQPIQAVVIAGEESMLAFPLIFACSTRKSFSRMLTQTIAQIQLVAIEVKNKEIYFTDYTNSTYQLLPSWLTLAFFLFFCGLLGMIYNYRSFLTTMMSVEVMYLGAVMSFVLYGIATKDINAAIYALVILIFTACESAVGLGLLILLYRFGYSVSFDAHTSLHS